MRAAVIARWRRHWLLLVYVGSVILVGFQFAGRGAANNLKIFRWSFFHLLAGQDIYLHYPDLYFDVFKYSPTWALLFAPFALPPPAVGFFLWDLSAALVFYHAVQRLLPGPEARLALAITFFEFLAAMQHASSTNSVVAALVILAFVGLEEERQGLAAVCIGVGALMKLYPLAALIFALFHRRKVRFGVLVTTALALLIALPLLLTSPTALLAQWRSWGGVLAGDTRERGASVMQLMHHWIGVDWPNWPVQLTGTVLLLLPVALRRDRWRDPHFRRLVLCSVLLYSLIFNHQAEGPSTVVGFTGIAIWYAMSPRTPWRAIVMALAFVLVSVLHSGLLPWPLRRNVLAPLQLIPIACLLVWVVVQVELLAGRAPGAAPSQATRPPPLKTEA